MRALRLVGAWTWSYRRSAFSRRDETSVSDTMQKRTRNGATLAMTLSLALVTGFCGRFCEGIAPYPPPGFVAPDDISR